MKWSDFIYRCGREIGRPEEWPEGASGIPVNQKHVDRAFTALMAVLTKMPFSRLSSGQPLSVLAIPLTDNGYLEGSMPTDLLSGREDLGIDKIVVGGKVVFPIQAVDTLSIFNLVGNVFQAGNMMFGFSPSYKNVYVTPFQANLTSLDLHYYKTPTKIALGSIATEDWPLGEYDTEAAIQVVSAHAAIDTQDSELFKAHSILANFYEGER